MSLWTAARLAAALGVVSLSATTANAVLYTWNFVKGQPQVAPNSYGTDPGSGSPVQHPGGVLESINSTFDNVTKRLTYDALFTGTTGPGSSPLTSGFWLVLKNGPNPKGFAGELAIIYFDAQGTNFSAPKMSVYGYNGLNNGSSYMDGNSASGTQTPELIKGTLETSFINSISATNETIGGVAMRRLKFDINAADIINFNSAYDTAADPWYGTGYNGQLGIWTHFWDVFTAEYDTTRGGIKASKLTLSGEGYLDGQRFTTNIPAPGSAALLGIGGLLAARRRRA